MEPGVDVHGKAYSNLRKRVWANSQADSLQQSVDKARGVNRKLNVAVPANSQDAIAVAVPANSLHRSVADDPDPRVLLASDVHDGEINDSAMQFATLMPSCRKGGTFRRHFLVSQKNAMLQKILEFRNVTMDGADEDGRRMPEFWIQDFLSTYFPEIGKKESKREGNRVRSLWQKHGVALRSTATNKQRAKPHIRTVLTKNNPQCRRRGAPGKRKYHLTLWVELWLFFVTRRIKLKLDRFLIFHLSCATCMFANMFHMRFCKAQPVLM